MYDSHHFVNVALIVLLSTLYILAGLGKQASESFFYQLFRHSFKWFETFAFIGILICFLTALRLNTSGPVSHTLQAILK